MNESLAARQEALQRQNQELNQQVEAIEQRRQQQLSRPSSSSSSTSLRGSRAPSPHLSPGKSDPLIHDEDQHADAKGSLEIELSASIDSLGSQELKEARRQLAKSESKEKVGSASRTRSAERPHRRKHHHKKDEPSPQSEPRSKTKSDASPARDDGSTPEGLGLEATVRYQKARLRVLQDEADAATAQVQQLQITQSALKAEIESLKTENAALNKKTQQTQQLLEKQRELSAAQETKQRILEGQLSAAQARVEETQRSEKLASQQFRSKDVRLNRALEELDKLRAQLQEERKNQGEQMVTKSEYDQVVRDNKKLDKQKGELLVAFKKQMKLIDLLKRQRIHMEAAKMLSFTEAEFSKTLELG